ncbi:hypothetical protein Bpfe_009214 [Biomphalaria pfeifferi]|uniref:Uncharacterized protein n=1 Tax=Biomphalaria pfeifferi TaxID=112525 RepID=A0AAD8BVG0_BIOPF|nr:hypothetical protein Bpfe_009214 [Biomphalaria pfeifferi]
MYNPILLLLEIGLFVLNGGDCSRTQNVKLEKGSALIIPCYTDYPEWFVTVSDVKLRVSYCDIFTCYNTFPFEFFAKHQINRSSFFPFNFYWPYLRVMNANKTLTQIQCDGDTWLINVTDSVQEQMSLKANWMRQYYDVQYKRDVTFVCEKWTGYGSELSLVRDSPYSVLASSSDSAIITYTMYNVSGYPPYFTVECTIDNDATKILIEVEENENTVTTLKWTSDDPKDSTSTTATGIYVIVSVFGYTLLVTVVIICIKRRRRRRAERNIMEILMMFHDSVEQVDSISAGQYRSLTATQLDNTTAGQHHSLATPQLDNNIVPEPPVYEECVHIFTIARVGLDTAAAPPPPAYGSLPPSYEDSVAPFQGVS